MSDTAAPFTLSRRAFAGATLAGLAMGLAPRRLLGGRRADRVVCYTSADSVYARQLFEHFTTTTGIEVDAVFDTEATKTTGLVQRLLNENDAARGTRADVWWSSEPFGTIRLARAGVLIETKAPEAEDRMKPHGGWPSNLRASDRTWYGFGSRGRVFVYNTKFVPAESAPKRLGDLLRPEFRGRVAIAKPQFGTTRGHFGALVHMHGSEAFEAWLTALKANGARVVDGNASVVAAVARGECRVGLTDTDDVYAGQREQWPVALGWEARDLERATPTGGKADPKLPGTGTMLIPNTVALVKNGANPAAATRLVEYLLSPEAQRVLAKTDSHNTPVDPDVRKEFAEYEIENPAELDHFKVADHIDKAMEICRKVLG